MWIISIFATVGCIHTATLTHAFAVVVERRGSLRPLGFSQPGSPHKRSASSTSSQLLFRIRRPQLRAASSTSVETKNEEISIKGSSLILYGHPGTRSPLISWAFYELGLTEFQMAPDLSKNPHPFRQLPCLVDAKDGSGPSTIVFESGAILQYLDRFYNARYDELKAGAIMSWITWANASLDPICFLETPDGKVYDTGLRKASTNRRMLQLEQILNQQKSASSNNEFWLVQNEFSLADVAVASYFSYVLEFFPSVAWWLALPTTGEYVRNALQRPAYAQAFGSNTQERLLQRMMA
jgi:glutathione S-transferase